MGHIAHILSHIEAVHSGFQLPGTTPPLDLPAFTAHRKDPRRRARRSWSGVSNAYLNILPGERPRRLMEVTGQEKSTSAFTALRHFRYDFGAYFSLLSW